GGVDNRVRNIIKALGLRLILWNASTGDDYANNTVSSIANTVATWNTGTYDRSISLEHDLTQLGADTIPPTLDALKSMGRLPMTVAECIGFGIGDAYADTPLAAVVSEMESDLGTGSVSGSVSGSRSGSTVSDTASTTIHSTASAPPSTVLTSRSGISTVYEVSSSAAGSGSNYGGSGSPSTSAVGYGSVSTATSSPCTSASGAGPTAVYTLPDSRNSTMAPGATKAATTTGILYSAAVGGRAIIGLPTLAVSLFGAFIALLI
ncbi:hypothetical protein HK405_001032, partial [Cladochytrium tenue]